jgi:imidazolonepropionase-like amidohydrolase
MRIRWIIGAALIFWLSIPIMTGAENPVIAIKGGRFFTGTKGTIDGGVLLIRDGKIVAVGKGVVIPTGAKVIDATSCFIMPGLIDAFTNLGTEEPGTLGSDSDEKTSPVTPQLRIIDSFDPENMFIPMARKAGVTAALVAPAVGNIIAGQCGLMSLWGDNAAAMTIKFPVAVQSSLGEAPKMRFGSKDQTPQTRMGEAALLRQTFIDVQNYLQQISDYEKKDRESKAKKAEGKEPEGEKPTPPPADLKLQALVPVLKGEIPFLVTANRLDDILTILRIADEFGLKIILNGGAALLFRAGVKIAFQTGTIKDAAGLVRQAQMAVANGLPREEGLRALTVNPAEIFGVAGDLGSLEKGKVANLTIFEADPLLSPTRVKAVIIRGVIAR